MRLLACAVLVAALSACGHYGSLERGDDSRNVALEEGEECEEDEKKEQNAEP